MHGMRITVVGMARRAGAGLLAVALVGSSASCGYLNKNGRSPVYLVIETMGAASGASPDTFGNILQSDVVTNVKVTVGGQQVVTPTVFEDFARLALKVALKDTNATATPTNYVTVSRYHVEFKRSDGRAAQGVDVPYAFDGAATGTITTNSANVTFVLVRAQAKLEAPLKALGGGGGAVVLSTIADVTVYGRDQNGNDVSVTGSISVNFADWGDPG
jgi:hypothetical protein